MRHARKIALAALAVLGTLAPMTARASSSRIEGTGLQADYLQDYLNVTLYPSTIVRYPNLVWGDLGVKNVDGNDLPDFQNNNEVSALDNAGRAMGANVTCKGLPGVWGVQMNENHIPLSAAYGAGYYNRNASESVTLLWGKKFGDTAFGLMFTRSNSSFEQGTTDNRPSPWFPPSGPAPGGNSRQIINSINAGLGDSPRNTNGVSAGLSFDWNAFGRRHTADIAAQYRSLNLHQEAVVAGDTQITEDNGGAAWAINARVQMAMTDDTYLVPVLNWYRMQLGTTFTDTGAPGVVTKYDNTVSGVNIGLAKGWVVRESDLLMLGLAVQHQSINWEDPAAFGNPTEVSYSRTPEVFGALEARPTGWLKLRLGAAKPVFSRLETTNSTTGVQTVRKNSEFQYALGVGFILGGRLDLDTVLNQDFAFTGGWVSSGLSEGPVSRISATYRF